MRFYAFFLSLLLWSCVDHYRGFDHIEEGVYFKLISFGEDSIPLQNSEYLLMAYNFCENSECDGVELTHHVAIKGSDLWKGFNLNDKSIFLFDEGSPGVLKRLLKVDSVNPSLPVIVVLKFIATYTDNRYIGQYTNYEEIMTYRENDLINQWLEHEDGYLPDSSGIYIDVLKQGSGDTALAEREVSVSYKAYFADGRMFDNTDEWADTFKYVVGYPHQVIAGLNAGIQGRREGCKAKIIIPSQLAFGQAGSSTGLVPPFEPLKYEITIIDVNTN